MSIMINGEWGGIGMEDSKVISLRLTPEISRKLMDDGKALKLSSKILEIVQNHFDTKYNEDHNWMMIPRSLGVFLFSELNDKSISRYCDILYEELIKVQNTQFPDKSLWETWLILDKDWNKKIGSIITYQKVGKIHHYYVEHKTNIAVSKIIYEMFLRTSRGLVKIEKKHLDGEKLALAITEL